MRTPPFKRIHVNYVSDKSFRRGLLVVLAVAATGCDFSGQYEKRFQESLQASTMRASFDQQLYAAETEVADAAQRGTGVKLRIPNFFNNDSKSLAAGDARANPPFLNLPGWSRAWERQLDDGSGKNFLPTYLYFAAVPKAPAKGEKAGDVAATLAQQLVATFPSAAWSDVQVPTPDGKTVTVKRIRVEGKQDFVDLQSNKTQNTDGRFDLYLVNSPDYHVLIGWRSPKPQGTRYFFAASDAAMGTLAAPAGGGGPAGKGGGGKSGG
jgi:hypothetical protein